MTWSFIMQKQGNFIYWTKQFLLLKKSDSTSASFYVHLKQLLIVNVVVIQLFIKLQKTNFVKISSFMKQWINYAIFYALLLNHKFFERKLEKKVRLYKKNIRVIVLSFQNWPCSVRQPNFLFIVYHFQIFRTNPFLLQNYRKLINFPSI